MSYPINPEPDDFFYGSADAEQAELEREGREYDRAQRRAAQLKADGDLIAAALECPHGGGYPLKSLASERESDPRAGEDGERCSACNSVLSGFPWEIGRENVRVIHPCEPRWHR